MQFMRLVGVYTENSCNKELGVHCVTSRDLWWRCKDKKYSYTFHNFCKRELGVFCVALMGGCKMSY